MRRGTSRARPRGTWLAPRSRRPSLRAVRSARPCSGYRSAGTPTGPRARPPASAARPGSRRSGSRDVLLGDGLNGRGAKRTGARASSTQRRTAGDSSPTTRVPAKRSRCSTVLNSTRSTPPASRAQSRSGPETWLSASRIAGNGTPALGARRRESAPAQPRSGPVYATRRPPGWPRSGPRLTRGRRARVAYRPDQKPCGGQQQHRSPGGASSPWVNGGHDGRGDGRHGGGGTAAHKVRFQGRRPLEDVARVERDDLRSRIARSRRWTARTQRWQPLQWPP
jgi:hypothetical protein